MTSLARQLADHDRWEWRGGMHYRFNGRRYLYTGCSSIDGMDAGCTPDIEHPATKGWLLAMLRGVEDARFAQCHQNPLVGEWRVMNTGGRIPEDGFPTEGEALARALLAAWGES